MRARTGVLGGALLVLGTALAALATGRVALPAVGDAPAPAPTTATVALGAAAGRSAGADGAGDGAGDGAATGAATGAADDAATVEAALPRPADLGPGWEAQPWTDPWDHPRDLLAAAPPPGCSRRTADELRFATAARAAAHTRVSWGATEVHLEVASYDDEATAAAVVAATVREDVGPCLAALLQGTYAAAGLQGVGVTVARWVPPAGLEGGGHTVLGLGWSTADRREVREAVQLQRLRCGRTVVTVRTRNPVEPMPGGDRVLEHPRAVLCPAA